MGRAKCHPTLVGLILAAMCVIATEGSAATYVPVGGGLQTAYRHGIMIQASDTCDLTGYVGTAVHILQATFWSDHVATGMPVGCIKVWYTDGSVDSVELVEGVNTAEWAYDRPELQSCLQHAKIEPAHSYLTRTDSAYEYWGHLFSVDLPLQPKPLRELELVMYAEPYTQTSDYGCSPADWFGIAIAGITLEVVPSDLDIVAIRPVSGYIPLFKPGVPAWAPGLSTGRRVCAPFMESPLVLQVQLAVPEGYPADWFRTECDWRVDGDEYKGESEFPGQLGSVSIAVPRPVRNRTLSLLLHIYASGPGRPELLVGERAVELPLSVTYARLDSLLPEVKELWAYYAARFGDGSINPTGLRHLTMLGIYAAGWPYKGEPPATHLWKTLLAGEGQAAGDCRAYAGMWASLCMVHGVQAESRPIYAAWQLARLSDQQEIARHSGLHNPSSVSSPRQAYFRTKSLAPPDQPSSPKYWDFNFHQVGYYSGECYDPVFKLWEPSIPAYERALLDTVWFRDLSALNRETTGGDLGSLIGSGYLRVYPQAPDYVYTCTVQDNSVLRFPPLPAPSSALASVRPLGAILETGGPVLSVWTAQSEYDLGSPITVLAAVTSAEGGTITGLSPSATFQAGSAYHELPMYDDGAHGDEGVGDGIYGAVFSHHTDSWTETLWDVCVSASGSDQGASFDLRECVLQGVAVSDLGAHFAGALSESPADEDGQLGFEQLAITAEVNVTGSGKYWLRGTLLKDDTEICHSYAEVPQLPGVSPVTLTFPGHSIRGAGLDGPYTVRLILARPDFTRIEDTDYATAAYLVDSFQQGSPVLFPIGNRSLGEGQLLAVQLRADDPEDDPIMYAVEPLPEGASLDPHTGYFQWSITHWQAGRHVLTFSASDGITTTEASVTVDVCQVPVFSDVPFTGFGPFGSEPFWAFYEIEACYRAGIVGGYDDGTYRPSLTVTRDQMAVFISRALTGGDSLVPTGPATATFSDVPIGYWAFKYVEYAVDNGVVAGYEDGTYRPDDTVTRDQMAVFIARALVGGDAYVPTGPPTAYFADVPTDHWAFKYVEYILGEGVTGGYPDGTYRPEEAVTRDQMAVYVQRAFALPL